MKITAERRNITVEKSKDEILEILNGALHLMMAGKLIVQDLLSWLDMDEGIEFGDDHRKIFDLRIELDYDEDDEYALVFDWKAMVK